MAVPVSGISTAAREAGLLASPTLTRVFRHLDTHPMQDLVARDILCYNIPQFALARSRDELLDMMPNSLSLTAVTIAGQVALSPALQVVASKLTGLPLKELQHQLTPELMGKLAMNNKLGRLAVALGFYFPFAAGFAAAPFWRNWLTLKRTGTADFEKIIGLRKGQKQQQVALEPKPNRSPAEEAKYQTQLGYNQQMTLKTLALGAGLGLVSLLGFSGLSRMATRGKVVAPAAMDKLFSLFALGGKRSSEVRGNLATMLFWLLPPYLGWLVAARSHNERIEHGVKSLNSVLWFSLFTPLFIKGPFLKTFEALGLKTGAEAIGARAGNAVQNALATVHKGLSGSVPSYEAIEHITASAADKLKALVTKNKYMTWSWLVPVTMLATTPQLLNIYFTRRRFKAAQQEAATQAQATTPLPASLPSTFRPAAASGPKPAPPIDTVVEPGWYAKQAPVQPANPFPYQVAQARQTYSWNGEPLQPVMVFQPVSAFQ